MTEVFIGENGGLYSFLYEISLQVGVGEEGSRERNTKHSTLHFVLISWFLCTYHANSNLVNPFIKFLFCF